MAAADGPGELGDAIEAAVAAVVSTASDKIPPPPATTAGEVQEVQEASRTCDEQVDAGTAPVAEVHGRPQAKQVVEGLGEIVGTDTDEDEDDAEDRDQVGALALQAVVAQAPEPEREVAPGARGSAQRGSLGAMRRPMHTVHVMHGAQDSRAAVWMQLSVNLVFAGGSKAMLHLGYVEATTPLRHAPPRWRLAIPGTALHA